MPPYLSPLHIVELSLPAQCEPANELLYRLSATFHTCVPTNLALLSTLLGACSIVSWLFAQLPQIYKNHTLKSTSGLSAFFLTEWLLGDVTNLLGCLFTGQATWQIIIATYYVFVDCCLCTQWVWYELLQHGRPLRPTWGRWSGPPAHGAGGGSSTMHQVWDGGRASDSADVVCPSRLDSSPTGKEDPPPNEIAQTMSPRSNPMDAFRIPNFARSASAAKDTWLNTPPSETSPSPSVRRVKVSSSPMPSPKTILYVSLIVAVLTNTSTAIPARTFGLASYGTRSLSMHSSASEAPPTASEMAGKMFSWMSTVLYLGSRLPQLYKNQVRKSTAGLSPALFAAAFFGNLFYSSSLLANPCAWYDFASGEGAGWVDSEGSVRANWVVRALPFFLGAAGVLFMDAAVGLQFVYFGDNEARGRSTHAEDDELIITVNDHGKTRRRRLHWRRVSGWMRGWAPAVSVAATPNTSRTATPVETPRSASPAPGGSSKGIPIQGQKDALEEARALLGTSRHASPRSYGAMPSPR